MGKFEGTQRSEAAVGSSVEISGEGFMGRAWSEPNGMFWLGSAWSELMSGDVHHRPPLCGQDVLKDPEVGYQFRGQYLFLFGPGGWGTIPLWRCRLAGER